MSQYLIDILHPNYNVLPNHSTLSRLSMTMLQHYPKKVIQFIFKILITQNIKQCTHLRLPSSNNKAFFVIITKTPATLSKKRRTNKFVATKGNSICHAFLVDQCPTLSKVTKSHMHF
jgi:hypothetical protein